MMSPSIMDVIRARQRNAEAQILDILRELQEETEMSVRDVRFTTAETIEGRTLIIDVKIDLEL